MLNYEKVKKDYSLLRLFILTFLGAGIHVTIILVSIWQLSPLTVDQTTLGVPQLMYLLGYFGFTIAYCVATTLSFNPKRIVSPLNIQLMVATILVIVFSGILLSQKLTPNPQNITTFASFVVIAVLVPFLLGFAGLVQSEIVRRIVGLNGTEENLDRLTIRLNGDFQTVSNTLKTKEILNLANFRIKEKESTLILKSRLIDTKEKIIFVLTRDPRDPLYHSILSTVVYEAGFYSIFKSSLAVTRRDSIIGEIEKRVSLKRLPLDDKESFNNEPSRIALRLALKATEPKIFVIGKIPRHILLIVTATIVFLGILIYSWIFGKFITQDLFVTSLVIVIVALLFEFIPFVRESRIPRAYYE